MKINMLIITRKAGSMLLVTSLAISLALAAPPQPQATSPSATSTTATAAAQTAPTTTSTTSPTSPSSKPIESRESAPKPLTSSSSPSPSPPSPSPPPPPANLNQPSPSPQTTSPSEVSNLASLRDGAKSSSSSSGSGASRGHLNSVQLSDELATFDGKNPFADDSLWTIPVHLVRDLSSEDTMARSASRPESSAAAHLDENDDDVSDEASGHMRSDSPVALSPTPSSSSPTVISASTDLKTAAGYHHGSYHGHGHGAGHYGDAGHHGGEHYGGKYFQYASVPYPYAWDFGYRRGNPYHTIERYEHGKGPHFKTKVKWSDKHGGYGVHIWDYNHDDHHSHHHYDGGHHDSHHGPSHHYGAGGHHGGHYGHH